MKSPAIKVLELLAIEDAKRRYPGLPESHYTSTRKYSDKTANGLCKCVIDWLRLNNWQSERILCTGRYMDNSKIVTDCIGRVRRVGSGKWIPASMQRGTSDLSATILGRSIKIELKIGHDKQSKYQKEYQKQVEAAGGVYYIAKDFDSFLLWYKDFLKINACRQNRQ
jgi:hypothetical protein